MQCLPRQRDGWNHTFPYISLEGECTAIVAVQTIVFMERTAIIISSFLELVLFSSIWPMLVYHPSILFHSRTILLLLFTRRCMRWWTGFGCGADPHLLVVEKKCLISDWKMNGAASMNHLPKIVPSCVVTEKMDGHVNYMNIKKEVSNNGSYLPSVCVRSFGFAVNWSPLTARLLRGQTLSSQRIWEMYVWWRPQSGDETSLRQDHGEAESKEEMACKTRVGDKCWSRSPQEPKLLAQKRFSMDLRWMQL